MLTALLALALVSPSTLPLPDSLPSCDSLLTGLSNKAEADYAGFKLEYQGARLSAYRASLDRLHRRARSTEGAACYRVLADYTDAFDDPHIFLFQNTYRDTAQIELAIKARRPQRLQISESDLRTRLAGGKTKADPLEGIWTDGTLRVAVVPADSGGRSGLAAVVLTSDTVLWHVGEVRARFFRRAGGGYEGWLAEGNLAERQVRPALYKRHLLRFNAGMWSREFPVPPRDSGLVSLGDPHRSTLTWRGATPVISIPSHDPGTREYLNQIVAANAATLRGAPRLIIDLRGNEGGSSWVTDTLLPVIVGPLRPGAVLPHQDGLILSSPDQIRYVQRQWRNFYSDSLKAAHLAERMAAHPGELVFIEDSADRARSTAPEQPPHSEEAGPRIGVMIDRGTVSASEVTVQELMWYARVTVYGLPTAGALDYQSTSIVPIGDPARRWYFGYPTLTANAKLPAGGMRGKGIAPDVQVDWDKVADPIGYVDNALMH